MCDPSVDARKLSRKLSPRRVDLKAQHGSLAIALNDTGDDYRLVDDAVMLKHFAGERVEPNIRIVAVQLSLTKGNSQLVQLPANARSFALVDAPESQSPDQALNIACADTFHLGFLHRSQQQRPLSWPAILWKL